MHNHKLQKLTKVWYAKLAKKGFKDIETDGWLTTWSGSKNFSSDHHALTEYYRLAGHYLHANEFKSPLHARIWQLHSEGFSYREIAAKLNVGVFQARSRLETMRREFFKFFK